MIRSLGPRLQDPGLWHINRRSVSGAVGIGLFCAFVPIPFQMVLAAILAILFRVNILITVPMVWISNPVTMPPLFYFCFLVGTWILNSPPSPFNFDLSFQWLASEMLYIWQPFLLGCLIVGSVCGLLGFFTVRVLWRYAIWQHIKRRKLR